MYLLGSLRKVTREPPHSLLSPYRLPPGLSPTFGPTPTALSPPPEYKCLNLRQSWQGLGLRWEWGKGWTGVRKGWGQCGEEGVDGWKSEVRVKPGLEGVVPRWRPTPLVVRTLGTPELILEATAAC